MSLIMKNFTLICAMTLFMAGAGCQSGHPQNSARVIKPAPAPAPAYIVKLIPNPQLTPTSREGNKPGVVYSSNIVAVYRNTNGMSAASLTNVNTLPNQGAKTQGR